MFSQEFMRYLINYQPDGFQSEDTSTVKEIEFKHQNNGKLAKVYLTIEKK